MSSTSSTRPKPLREIEWHSSRLIDSLAAHWPEYLMEAAQLGMFMIAACALGTLLSHPASPVSAWIPGALWRRVLMGVGMGATAIAIIYSPWGQQSGAHLNPSVTLTFLRLGKVGFHDAVSYVLAQFAGGVAGVWIMARVIGRWLSDPAVRYVATVPGMGAMRAFFAEAIISLVLMLTILTASNSKGLSRFTGVLAGLLVATYIVIESPISGMSMNPARSLASAVPARLWADLWIYFTAPPLGMFVAAEIYMRWKGAHRIRCAKLNHNNGRRCIFHCGYRNGGAV